MKLPVKTLSGITALLMCSTSVWAQTGTPVKQSGNVTPGHPAMWTTNGVIQDAGTAFYGYLTGLGVTAQGPGICQNSAPVSQPYNQICLSANTNSNAILSLQNYGGAPAEQLQFNINGTVYTFPFAVGGIVGPSVSTVGDCAIWNNNTGSLLKDEPCSSAFGSQSVNTVFAGPSIGTVAGIPTFRPLVGADLPFPAASSLGGIESITQTANEWIAYIDTSGVPHQSQPGFSNLSGQMSASQFPSISTSTIIANFLGSVATAYAAPVPSCASDGTHTLTNPSGSGLSCSSVSVSAANGFYTLSHITGSWACTAPNGSTVSTSGTTTSGLQECINAMQTNHDGNFHAVCPPVKDNVPIAASSTITFGPNTGALYDLRGCFIQTSVSSGDAIVIDTLDQGSVLDWSSGFIQCTGSSETDCIDFFPQHEDPVTGFWGISWGYIRLPTIEITGCTADGGVSHGVRFDSNGGVSTSNVSAIFGEKIEIGAIDGYSGTHNCVYNGIFADNPTNDFAAFGQNYIYVGYIQGFANSGVQLGTSELTQATQALGTNQWDIGSIGSGANPGGGNPSNGFYTYGFLDRININISVNSGSLANGLVFASATSNGNWFVAPQISGATTALSDNGTSVSNVGFYNGTVHNF